MMNIRIDDKDRRPYESPMMNTYQLQGGKPLLDGSGDPLKIVLEEEWPGDQPLPW